MPVFISPPYLEHQLMSSGEGEDVTRNLMHVYCFSLRPNVKKMKNLKKLNFWKPEMSKGPHLVRCVNRLDVSCAFQFVSDLISLKCFAANSPHCICTALCEVLALHSFALLLSETWWNIFFHVLGHKPVIREASGSQWCGSIWQLVRFPDWLVTCHLASSESGAIWQNTALTLVINDGSVNREEV